jgi:hypothetical protein
LGNFLHFYVFVFKLLSFEFSNLTCNTNKFILFFSLRHQRCSCGPAMTANGLLDLVILTLILAQTGSYITDGVDE